MDTALILEILKMILCNPAVRSGLEDLAARTDTPIDDIAVSVIYTLLGCPGKKTVYQKWE